MKKLLITGFDAFGTDSVNPSWEAVQRLPEEIGDFQLKKLGIPTVFGQGADDVLATAQDFQPDLILCVGLAAGRDAVTPERIAVNIRHARIPDNRGFQPQGERIVPDGPAAYFTTVPVEAMARAIQKVNVPGTVSNTAGTYVCNDVLYTLLHHYAGTPVQVGFIHVPYLPEQGSPSLPLGQTIAALIAAIETC